MGNDIGFQREKMGNTQPLQPRKDAGWRWGSYHIVTTSECGN